MCHRKQNIEKRKLCVRPTVRFDFSARKDNAILNTAQLLLLNSRLAGSMFWGGMGHIDVRSHLLSEVDAT